MIENINEMTGEVVEFHTRYSTVSDVGEQYVSGTSLTDATQYEPIQSLVERIIRPRSDLVWSEEIDPMDAPGFDLVDISDVMDDVNSVVAEQNVPEGTSGTSGPALAETTDTEVEEKE